MDGVATNIEMKDIVNQFIQLMEQQKCQGEQQAYLNFINYTNAMSEQFGKMNAELEGLRKQVEQLQDFMPKNKSLSEKVSDLQSEVKSFGEKYKLTTMQILESMKDTVDVYKEGGREKMLSFLEKGVSWFRDVLSEFRDKLQGIEEKHANVIHQIDRIGVELNQINTGYQNIGNIMTGKETVEAEKKNDSAFLNALKKPVMKSGELIHNAISSLDKILDKVDRYLDNTRKGRETAHEKKESVLAKLNARKEKIGENSQDKENIKEREKEAVTEK